jgi:hypothetical protein
MRTYPGKIMFLLLVGLLVALPAAAQDVELSERFSFDDGATFEYPDDWDFEHRESDPFALLYSDDTQILILDSGLLEDMEDSDLENVVEAYFLIVYEGDLTFDEDDIEAVEIGGREAIRYPYEDTFGDGALLIAIRLSDGGIGVIDAVSLEGDLSEEDVVLAVAESLDRGGEGASTVVIADGTPCMVSTDVGNAVALRVGPGINRTSFAFLPASEDFEVLGAAEADDGSLWWKLDREEVAPTKSAAEAWVAQLDVDAEGGCDAVVDVNAPPLIPIVGGGQPAASGGSSGDSGSGGQPAGAGEAIPQSGSWTITFPKSAPGSCVDVPTQNLQIDIPSDVVSLSGANGSSLVFDGDRYNRIGANTYQGSYVNIFGDSVLFTLRVASSTQMVGEFIWSFVQDGHQCSITVTSSITHN